MSQGGGDSVSRKRVEGTVSQGEWRGKCHRGRGGESVTGGGKGKVPQGGRREGTVLQIKGGGDSVKGGEGGSGCGCNATYIIHTLELILHHMHTHTRMRHTHTSHAHTHTWNIDISVTNLYNLHSAPVQREQVKVDQHTLHTTQISPRTPSAEEMLGLSLCPCPSLQQSWPGD